MAQQGVIVPQASTPTFPGCALSCSTLLYAQDICMPPNVPASNQQTYNQCFCNSAFLTPFATTTDQVCVAECTLLDDRRRLQDWYNTFCAQVRNGIDPTTQTTSAPANAATTGPTQSISTVTSGTTVSTITATPTSSSGAAATSAREQSWIEGHWKWILMLVILALGLAGLAWLIIWLKKRHRRKVETRRAAASGFGYDPEKRPANDPRRSATPDLWGPHQMMQATQGYGYTTDTISELPSKNENQKSRGTQRSSSKRLTKEAVDVIDRETISSPSSSRRARPSELETNAKMIGAADRRSKRRGRNRTVIDEQKAKEVEAGPSAAEPRSRSYSPQRFEEKI